MERADANPFLLTQTPGSLSDINVVVIGAGQVGKSTFVEKALDVTFPSTTRAAERKIHVKGSDYFVRLLEVAIEDVDWDEDDETVIWPETIDDKMMPRVDGALLLYDITDKNSLENVPETLSKSGDTHSFHVERALWTSVDTLHNQEQSASLGSHWY